MTWRESDGRVAVAVTVTPGAPRVGQEVRARIVATFDGGSRSGRIGSFNYRVRVEGIDSQSNGTPGCTQEKPPDAVRSFEKVFEWAGTYDKPGQYDVAVQFSPRCIADDSVVTIHKRIIVRA